MSGKMITALLVCVIVIMLVMFISGYRGQDKGADQKTGYERSTGKVEGSFDAKGMDTRLNEVVVHDLDVVRGKVADGDAPDFMPEKMPSFEVKEKAGAGGPEIE